MTTADDIRNPSNFRHLCSSLLGWMVAEMERRSFDASDCRLALEAAREPVGLLFDLGAVPSVLHAIEQDYRSGSDADQGELFSLLRAMRSYLAALGFVLEPMPEGIEGGQA